MEAKERARSANLKRLEALAEDPTGHHIYQALRLIEATYSDKPRLGESSRPSDDPVRFSQSVEMAFQPANVQSFELPEDGKPGKLKMAFFGLFGPQGPMPTVFTEYIRDRIRNHRDHTAADFVGMFVHRMTTLLYRAWVTGQPAASFDREEDEFSDKVDAIAGYRGHSFAGADLMPDLTKRHFAAHLAHRTRNPEGLAAILSAFFAAPVEIEDFVGSWQRLEPSDRWQLGANGHLGDTTVAGESCWTRSDKFRIRIGPVGIDEYRRMFPGKGSLQRLQAIIRNYSGDTVDWELNLVLKKEDVAAPEVGQSALLGFTCWPGERADPGDAADLFITPETGRYLTEGLNDARD